MHTDVMKLRAVSSLLLWLLLVSACAAAENTRSAAMAMPDAFSAAIAEQVLRSGGNAIDVTVAVGFSLAVTLPEAGNIGGGGFMTAFIDGQPLFLDFRERAPAAATADMYLQDGTFVQRRSLVGGLAVGVPGTVRGLQAAHARYGSKPWAELLEPAIRLATEGFVVPVQLAAAVTAELENFADETNFAEHFGGLRAGQLWRQPQLADTLRRLAVDPEDFYRGHIARQLVQQMQASGGLITAPDLEQYRAVWRQPVLADWRGYQLVSAPPPSSGGIALAQLLGMRDALPDLFRGVAHNSATYIHLLAEIEKRVFADRGDYLGDPDFAAVPVAELIDPGYLQRRASQVNKGAISASATVTPGLESVDTTHFSVIDGAGNAVALTYTLNWDFGSGVVVDGAGFLLNNEMDDFSAQPGTPNAFGVIGGDMNAIAPGKRMLSSMSPSLLLRDGEARMVLGTRGGSTIFTSIFQVILNVMDYGMDAAAAVNATRFHHQLPAGRLIRHDGGRTISASLQRGLEDYGYAVEPNSWGDLGAVRLVLRDSSGRLQAAADSRQRGVAKVLELATPAPLSGQPARHPD
jgi:gamma-glutamyltranspeptidase/glutathione hydrolase